MQNQNNILYIVKRQMLWSACMFHPAETRRQSQQKNVFILLVDKWWYSKFFQILFAMFFNTQQTIHFDPSIQALYMQHWMYSTYFNNIPYCSAQAMYMLCILYVCIIILYHSSFASLAHNVHRIDLSACVANSRAQIEYSCEEKCQFAIPPSQSSPAQITTFEPAVALYMLHVFDEQWASRNVGKTWPINVFIIEKVCGFIISKHVADNDIPMTTSAYTTPLNRVQFLHHSTAAHIECVPHVVLHFSNGRYYI